MSIFNKFKGAFKLDLKTHAARMAKLKSFQDEFKLGIIITWTLRFLTAAFSTYCGYLFYADLITPINSMVSPIIPIIISVGLILIVEFFAAWFLIKGTKMSQQSKWNLAIVFFIGAVITFTWNFISSTNGLAMAQSEKVDNTEIIKTEASTEKQNIISKYDVIVSDYKMQIEQEKANPQGWKDGQRAYLTAAQLKQISLYNDEIKAIYALQAKELEALKAEKATQISANTNNMTQEASRYYWLVAVVMFISLVTNITTQLFATTIYKEENPKEYAADLNKIMAKKTNDDLQKMVQKKMFATYREQKNNLYFFDEIQDQNKFHALPEYKESEQEDVLENLHKPDDEVQYEEEIKIEVPKQEQKQNATADVSANNKKPTITKRGMGFNAKIEVLEDENKTNLPYSAVEEKIVMKEDNPWIGICQKCGKTYHKKALNQKWCNPECSPSFEFKRQHNLK